MSTKKGFTLVELLVGITIVLLIFGSIIGIFGSSFKLSQTGLKQQEAYAEARQALQEIKTTLRYADKNSVVFNAEHTLMTYSGKYFDKHWEAAQGANVLYRMTLDFSNGKQLVIKKELVQGTEKKQTVLTFPKVEAHSAFISTREGAAAPAWLEWKNSGTPFPVREIVLAGANNAAADNIVYEIILPLKYLDAEKQVQTDVLQTTVGPTDFDDEKMETKVYHLYTRVTDLVAKWNGSSAEWNKFTWSEKSEIQSFYHYYYDTYKEWGRGSKLLTATVDPASVCDYLGDNERIREYLEYVKFTGHAYPLVQLDDGSPNGVQVQLEPTGKADSSGSRIVIPTASVFVYGRSSFGAGSIWYTEYIYNHETQTWYTGPGFSVRNLDWPEAWAKMQNLGWHPLALKNN